MPPLFVYGTLRPGGSNHALLEGAVSHFELAQADGLALYAARGFPYAAPDSTPGARITGNLCWIKAQAGDDTLSRLDLLEGYQANQEATSHYLRRRWTVITTEVGRAEAWIYLAGPRVDLSHLRRIPGGDWLQQPATTHCTT